MWWRFFWCKSCNKELKGSQLVWPPKVRSRMDEAPKVWIWDRGRTSGVLLWVMIPRTTLTTWIDMIFCCEKLKDLRLAPVETWLEIQLCFVIGKCKALEKIYCWCSHLQNIWLKPSAELIKLLTAHYGENCISATRFSYCRYNTVFWVNWDSTSSLTSQGHFCQIRCRTPLTWKLGLCVTLSSEVVLLCYKSLKLWFCKNRAAEVVC